MPARHTDPRAAAQEVSVLYRRYVTLVRNRAMRILNNAAAAQDVAQEVFIKYLEAGYAADSIDNIAAFLYRMATNAAISRLRGRARLQGLTNEPRGDGRDALESSLVLQRVLAAADEEDARMAAYYYIDGLGQEDIARLFDMPRRTVAYHLERFRAEARKFMAGESVPEGALRVC